MTRPDDRVALIAGVTGIAGSALADRLHREGWRVVGLARSPAGRSTPVERVQAELDDPTSLARSLDGLRPTHVFYTAWKRHDTEAENIAVNGAMVRNLLDAVGPQRSVRHVALLTGLKHYIGPPDVQGRIDTPDTPFREDAPRRSVPHFYYAQEDELFAGAARYDFTWTVHRAHTIIGHAVGNAMNMALTLAVAAVICREESRPFAFPGSEIRWNGLGDITDTGLLGQHLEWGATTPVAANEAFNVVNGDVFRWRTMWPRIAEMLGVEPVGFNGEPRPFAKQMTGSADTWRRIAERYNLVEPEVDKVASWWHTDGDLGRTMEMLADMSKSRAMGFTGYVRTDDAFARIFERYVRSRVVPPVPARRPTAQVVR